MGYVVFFAKLNNGRRHFQHEKQHGRILFSYKKVRATIYYKENIFNCTESAHTSSKPVHSHLHNEGFFFVQTRGGELPFSYNKRMGELLSLTKKQRGNNCQTQENIAAYTLSIQYFIFLITYPSENNTSHL